MNAPALNLLRYPRRGAALQIGPWRPLVLTLLAGTLSGAVWVGWQHWRLAQMQSLRQRVLAETAAWAAQQKAAAAVRDQSELQRAVVARAGDWQMRQAQWLHLQDALQDQAHVLRLRVLRWQADDRQLQLQAWLPRVQDIPALTSALSAAVGAQAWSLNNLAEHPNRSEGGVDVLLQAPWPPQGPEKTKARTTP